MKNTKVKRLLAFLLALCLLTAALPLSVSAAEYSGSCGTNLKWSIADDTLTITETGEMNDYKYASHQPWSDFQKSFTKIVVEPGVTYLGENCFSFLDHLKTVTLPETITSIGKGAFACSYELEGITIPPAVTVIPDGAFYSCFDLAYAEIPDTVTTIGESAFASCESLVDVNIPSKVKSIGEKAFQATAITTAVVPAGAVLGEKTFSSCDYLTDVELGNGMEELPYCVFEGCDSLKTIHIPRSVKTIAMKAFLNCVSLEDVILEEGLEKVDYNAFERCTNLQDVVFPSTCSYIGLFAFYYAKPKSITLLNPKCEIYDSSDTLGKMGITTIRGYKGSTAEAYALKYGYAFEALEGEPETPVSFTDVKVGDFFYDSVMWAVENEITSGTSATTFSPNKTCTRADAMTFLWRAAGKPEPSSTVNPFSDVKPDAYYYKAVLWAVENKITAGVSADRFGSSNTCTRGQIMTFLYRLAGSPSISSRNPFTDVAEGKSYYNAVLWAVEEGITAGTTATTFSPNSSCKRGQIVTFLYRYYV
jgi:hypothetical protein